ADVEAAAALRTAAACPDVVNAVVISSGRPDLAGEHLRLVRAPLLMIVGADDNVLLTLNERARPLLHDAPHEIVVVPEESRPLLRVAQLARQWFERYLVGTAAAFLPQ